MRSTISLNRNKDFVNIYSKGKSVVKSAFVAHVRRSRLRNINRLGITATKKLGGAVQRNRARRIIRESYRLLEGELKTGFDIVFVARSRSLEMKSTEIQPMMRAALTELGLMVN